MAEGQKKLREPDTISSHSHISPKQTQLRRTMTVSQKPVNFFEIKAPIGVFSESESSESYY